MRARRRVSDKKDGQWRWVESTASNLLDVPRVSAIVVVYREIENPATDSVETQTIEELRLPVDHLRPFAHTVAHDLREPLRSIAACTELLLRRASLDSAGQQNAQFIVDGVKRMSSLLDHLLASSTRGLDESLHYVNLEYAAAQALENLREAVRSSGGAAIPDRVFDEDLKDSHQLASNLPTPRTAGKGAVPI